MLHGPAEDVSESATPNAAETATPSAATPVAPAAETAEVLGLAETRERIARFNERHSGTRRSLLQMIEDAPVLLRRLWLDLRRGDAHVLGELMRRGVQLQILVAMLYILSPVSGKQERWVKPYFLLYWYGRSCVSTWMGVPAASSSEARASVRG